MTLMRNKERIERLKAFCCRMTERARRTLSYHQIWAIAHTHRCTVFSCLSSVTLTYHGSNEQRIEYIATKEQPTNDVSINDNRTHFQCMHFQFNLIPFIFRENTEDCNEGPRHCEESEDIVETKRISVDHLFRTTAGSSSSPPWMWCSIRIAWDRERSVQRSNSGRLSGERRGKSISPNG